MLVSQIYFFEFGCLKYFWRIKLALTNIYLCPRFFFYISYISEKTQLFLAFSHFLAFVYSFPCRPPSQMSCASKLGALRLFFSPRALFYLFSWSLFFLLISSLPSQHIQFPSICQWLHSVVVAELFLLVD